MIITCQKCHARFRLDDSRVTEKGVKVRCTKCKNIFTVQKGEPEVGAVGEPEGVSGGFSPSPFQDDVPDTTGEDHRFAADSSPEAPFDTAVFEESSFRNKQPDFGSLNTSPFDGSALSFEADVNPFDDVDKGAEDAAEPVATGGGIDFSNIDFGEAGSGAAATPLSAVQNDTLTETAPPVFQQGASRESGFSDEMFANTGTAVSDGLDESGAFGAEAGDSSPIDTPVQGSGALRGSLFALDASDDVHDSAGRTDTPGKYIPVTDDRHVPDAPHLSRSTYFPQMELQDKPEGDADGSPVDDEELPPLLIASRRKRSPVFAALITVVAVVLLSVLGYFGYTSFFVPKEPVIHETVGKISIRAVKAAFVKNDTAGELLVVSGEALNEYSKPRAALQVKVTVLDAANHGIATKSAYGGNPLTKEQLETLPLDKIEATMANQFGDSLANMELAPGKAIPFVVVLANLPEGAKDFTVESAGSTVATVKQQ